MNSTLTFILIETLIVFPAGILLLKLIFKNSLTFKFALAIVPGIYVTGIAGYIVGKYGLIMNIWTAPVTIFVFVLCFRYILKNIQKPIDNVTENLKNIGEGKLNNDFDNQKFLSRKDEVGNLYNSGKLIDNYLIKIVLDINNTIDSVLSAGSQLNSAAQNISERASEQASTTEEIASSMEEMVATIISNTEKAEYTGKISSESAQETEKSSKILEKTIDSVSEISDKISIISEFADKTDILSINAAIEAARAGENGKGFAVIAGEIRKLADKIANTSNEIEQLSNEGKEISKTAGESLSELIPSILNSAKLVNNIVIASREQKSNVENINSSVQQLSDITNENLASAEEMSSSSEELTAQAEQLKELISVFEIRAAQ